MTVITPHTRDNLIMGITVKGHSGHGISGQDIVCAAISAAVQLTECQLTDVLSIQLDIEQKEGMLSLKVRQEADLEPAQPPFKAFLLTAAQWALEYPKNIKIREVK